jgi:diguanylate cyclase (GGDEF)-like protein
MLKNVQLVHKLPLILISFALMAAIATGTIAYLQSTRALYDQTEATLFALLESRETTLRQYLGTVEKDVLFHSQSPLMRLAMQDFVDAWQIVPGNKETYLKEHYTQRAPYTFERKNNQPPKKDMSVYSDAHSKYHTAFVSLIASRSFYDIFLLDRDGNVIYTALKEFDFAKNVSGNPDLFGLNHAYEEVIKSYQHRIAVFSDFKPYAPSNSEPAGFVAAPVFDASGNLLGILSFQLAINAINEIMQVTVGMGKTGETYLVGIDKLMRSDSRFIDDGSILEQRVDTVSVERALSGDAGVHVSPDYRNVSVYSAYKFIDFLGVRWAILAEIDEAEVLQPVYQLNFYLIIIGLVLAAVIACVGYLLARDLSRPILSMVNAMNRLATNDLDTSFDVPDRKDEVGLMGRALVHFQSSALEREKLRAQLSHMALHDAMTGLPNRDHALEHLRSLLETSAIEGNAVSIFFADLDGFKHINDTFGHQVGDAVLKEASDRFLYSLRDQDMVARIGGDEFLFIVSHDHSENEREYIAEKILLNIEKPFKIANSSVHIGVSIGIATYPTHATNIRDLLRLADEAMYRAKARGKNRFAYCDDLIVSQQTDIS